MIMFQNVVALNFLKGLIKGILHSTNIATRHYTGKLYIKTKAHEHGRTGKRFARWIVTKEKHQPQHIHSKHK